MFRFVKRPLLSSLSLAESSLPAARCRDVRHIHRNTSLIGPTCVYRVRHPPSSPLRAFSSTPRNQAWPLVPLLAGTLKASASLEIVRTAARVLLTFVPFLLLKNHKTRRVLKHGTIHGEPVSEEKKVALLKRLRTRTIVFHVLLSIPALVFWATIVASMERTPLTGRWRMIVLSPEEEEEIAAQLAGPGWYNAVGEILAQDGPINLVAFHDWRYLWVRDTLRKLEATIPILMKEEESCPQWLQSVDYPMPPPAEHPLRPRPRASEYLRSFCEMLCEREAPPVPHSILGPPYSLLVVEKPDASNAFSYGFGPDGGGGVVVYTGFLDDIFSRIPPPTCQPNPEAAQESWLSSIFGNIISQPPPPPQHNYPTPEQTAELAILLAHELSHLILSHHLETLSSATVFVPGALSIFSDVIRVIIFPMTMLFGPFVNDAVAQLGKLGSGELSKAGDYCTSVKQEIEADVVSARLLAHAGFDARKAVSFWEDRACLPTECANAESIDVHSAPENQKTLQRIMAHMGSAHPVNDVRVDKLKGELVRWETERRAALARLRNPLQQSSIDLFTA